MATMLLLSLVTMTLIITCSHANFDGQYKINKNEISVSGFGAGANMATQMHVICSGSIMGVAMLAGTPFHCAGGDANQTDVCQKFPDYVNVDGLITATEAFANQGLIDPPEQNMKKDRVYLFNGELDTEVVTGALLKVREFYENYVKKPSDIKTESTIQAQHGFRPVAGATAQGQLTLFDQTEFFPPGVTSGVAGMGPQGYIYVPPGCQDKNKPCKLHIVFHGCLQAKGMVGDVFVTGAGYNQVADVNDIIILYPQGMGSVEDGCFDWWGYTGSDYDTNVGLQTSIVKAMIDSLQA